MFDQIKESVSETRDRVQQYTNLGEPNERNEGIGKTENLIAFGAALGATFLVRELLEASWRGTLDRDPPKNPSSPAVGWQDAIAWGALSGAVIGVARIASRRLASKTYRSL